MSIFKTENCPICGNPTKAKEKTSAKYNGLFLCRPCFRKITQAGINVLQLKKQSLEELQSIVNGTSPILEEQSSIVSEADQTLDKHQNEIDNFQITRQVGNYLYLDETQRKFALPKLSFTGKVKDMDIFDYADIVDFELLEDDKSVSKGGVGRAVVGGALFGGVGAIVGSTTGHKKKQICKKLQIKITINDISNPIVYINLITSEVKKDGILYKMAVPIAQEILSLLSIICQENSKENSDLTSTVSVADEIKKYKELLDMGAITLDEFEKKKKDLLNL